MRFRWVGRWLAVAIVLLPWLPAARADYIVLQSGQRIHVTGYERRGRHASPDHGRRNTGNSRGISAPSRPGRHFPAGQSKLLDVPFADFIADSAQAHGVAPELVASVIAVESNFNPNAVSLAIGARLDAIDAGNGGALWRDEHFRSRAKYRSGHKIPEGIAAAIQRRSCADARGLQRWARSGWAISRRAALPRDARLCPPRDTEIPAGLQDFRPNPGRTIEKRNPNPAHPRTTNEKPHDRKA